MIGKGHLVNQDKKFHIICQNNPELIFEEQSDEFTYHIVQCDNCLKDYLLYQARMKKEQKNILNYERNYIKKIQKKDDINNSMINNINNEDKNNSSDNSDLGSYESNNEKDSDNEVTINYINVRKNKKKEKKIT